MNETFEGRFSLLQMFWGSISKRPLRSSLSVVAISIQVILVLMIAGVPVRAGTAGTGAQLRHVGGWRHVLRRGDRLGSSLGP